MLSIVRSFQGCLRRFPLVRPVSSFIDAPLNYINGERVEPTGTTNFDDFEPATGVKLASSPNSSREDVDSAVQCALDAFKIWSQYSGSERASVLRDTAALIKERKEDIAKFEVIDNGKPIWEARFDIQTAIDTLNFYAGLAPSISGEHIQLPGGSFAYTRREPLGVCVGIGAWNYPFQICSWKAAPALACGNTMIFKPSPLTPITVLIMAEILTECGLPKGAFNVVQGGGDTGNLLTSHPDIAKVTFTGSTATGKKIMSNCAEGIKYVTLELGGKSPLIIFADCDLDNAVKGAMMANFLSQGQVCSNGTRVFVENSIMDEFLERLLAKTQAMRIGNPLREDTHVGASISKEHVARVLAYIQSAKDEGAEVLCGGEQVIPADPDLAGGHYISPCIMVNCRDGMKAVSEEIFGPVMAVMGFDSEEEAVTRANDTQFGLAGGVFTRDIQRGHRVIAQLQAGSCYINNYNVTPSEIPFGGHKHSGLGRENGITAIEHFTQLKSVYVEMGDVDCPY